MLGFNFDFDFASRFAPEAKSTTMNELAHNESSTESSPLEGLSFRFPLRRYQQEIIELTRLKLERGEKELHIVAPPGAGKTIIGLQLANQLKANTLIISPTTTIQGQWAEKLSLFIPPGEEDFDISYLIGTHEDKPLKPITLLTYQVLSTPARELEFLEKLAHKAWKEELSSSGLSHGNAELRILELMQNNKKAYDKEISRHISKLRRKLTEVLDLKEVLHPNALSLIQALKRQHFSTIIFDECHHLTDYWAAIMIQVVKILESDKTIVIGLTGTPPEGKSANQENRYLSLVGEIDYQVPTPALVREGGLAPFQDLVYFCMPSLEEERFLAEQHSAFHELLLELSAAESSLLRKWVEERAFQICKNDGWNSFAAKNAELSCAYLRFMYKFSMTLPDEIEYSEYLSQSPFIDDWICLLEDFALNHLKLSASARDHQLYERIKESVAKLGFGLTERGLRKQASPVDRVLAFSKSKARAAAEILELEYRSLGERLRAVIVTDFERMSATAVKQVKGVLTEESGGAIAALRELLKSNASENVHPCLVTGSLILVDKRIAKQFKSAMEEMLLNEGFEFGLTLTDYESEAFMELKAESSSQWEARLYVRLATRILERGICKVLIGTRGIFGEGWDCQSLNTLLDLTTTTTPVSVKQLRGRSIRIDTSDPLGSRKVANNWDIVCIAPHLEKGLNDYQRFAKKHAGYFGICDDGQIECGVGHVHPSFSELSAAEIFANIDDFNQEMKLRALAREGIYELWKVGQAYNNKTLGCIEIAPKRKLMLTPPHIKKDLSYPEHARLLRANLQGVWLEYGALGAFSLALAAFIISSLSMPLALSFLPLVGIAMMAARKHESLYQQLLKEICRPNTQDSSLFDMARALLSSLQHCKMIPSNLGKESIKISLRSDGSYRVFLDDVDLAQSQYFVKCFKELLEPVRKQPFLIPKYEYIFPELGLDPKEKLNTKENNANQPERTTTNANPGTELKPYSEHKEQTNEPFQSEERFFRAYLKGRAQPRIAAYYPVPSLLARSEKGRDAFQAAWNKYVSPGFIIATESKPELLNRYFGLGASLAQRLLWE